MLRELILALLSEQPNSGYGLGRLLRERLSHLREARLQQIYAELARLQEAGLVSAQTFALANRPAKKVYALTDAGQRALDAWLLRAPAAPACRDELLAQLYRIDRMPRDCAAQRLEERRRQSELRLTALRERLAQLSRTDPHQLGERLTLEAAIARAEAEASWSARWLDFVRNGVDSADDEAARWGATGGQA